MSNTLITLLVVFAFAAGLGLGLVVVMRPRSSTPVVMSAKDYKETFMRRGDNDPDHPHDIERQHAHRYDGMTDGNAPYIASGLDFGREPR